MTTFGMIFFIVLFFGIVYFLYIIDIIGDHSFEFPIFGSLILSFIIFIIFFIIGLNNVKYEKSNISNVTNISSLSFGSSVNGKFFLGSGTVNEKNYYYYMSNTELGYKLSKVEITENTYVREDTDKKPYIEFTKYNAVKLNWFGSLFFKKSTYNKQGEIIIHIPKNSVIKKYNVDVSDL